MNVRLFEPVRKRLKTDFPATLQNLAQHLDWMLPKVRPWSEELSDPEFFLNTRWLEITDREDFQHAILHIFLPEGAYLLSVDGDIREGTWRVLEGSNTFILEGEDGRKELFDLAFLNQDFFILKKHGYHSHQERPGYFVLGHESKVNSLSWREALDLLLNVWRKSTSYQLVVRIVLVIFALIVAFSLFF